MIGSEHKPTAIFVFVILAVTSLTGDLCQPCCQRDPCPMAGPPTQCPAGVDCTNCCDICPEVIDLTWPVDTSQLADAPLASTCEGAHMPGHFGLDLYAPDGEAVLAAFDGRVSRFVEFGTPAWYDLGCALILESGTVFEWWEVVDEEAGIEITEPRREFIPDNKYIAYYGHMLADAAAEDGEILKAGELMGFAGGGQEDPECRGDSRGPRLYFEMRYLQGQTGYDYVDPYSCTADSCRFWYTQNGCGTRHCTPGADNPNCKITRDPDTGEYRWPGYSCGTNQVGVMYYSEVEIDRYGRVDLSCTGRPPNRICASEIYGLDADEAAQPLLETRLLPGDMENLNCFLKFIRVYSTGEYTCGKIDCSSGPCFVDWTADEECSDISMLTNMTQTESNNPDFLRLQQIVAGEQENYGRYIVVSGEYVIIGIDDSNFVDQNAQRAQNQESFHPEGDLYHNDYVLVRRCDLQGRVQVKETCKNRKLTRIDSPRNYITRVNDAGFKECKYSLLERGKFYDNPGLLLATFDLSRMAANRGMLYYQVLDPEEEITEEAIEESLEWWNDNAIDRIWGCGGCEMGDIACSMGSSIAAKEGTDCGWIKKQTDYYGYNDIDDLKAAENPKFERYDGVTDLKFDYESGIPDESIVRESVRSIKTELNAFMINKVLWRGPPYWMHLHNPGPGGDNLDWNIWLMPCDSSENVKYWCRWASCECDGMTRPISYCEANWQNENCKGWKCTPYTVDEEDSVKKQGYCGYGGTRFWSKRLQDTLFYDDYPRGRSTTGENTNDDIMPEGVVGDKPYGGRTGSMPDVLGDEDLVRDRYWKPDRLGYEFYGTRPGYCSGESPQQVCQDDDDDDRDNLDRPASKQHDPCKACNQDDVCPEECFTYHSDYFRQFNIDSVWAHIFKINPEVTYPLTGTGEVPDKKMSCLPKLPGEYECAVHNVHEGDCDDEDDCIDGLECVDAPGFTEYCCPTFTHYADGCCRWDDTEQCVKERYPCPDVHKEDYLRGIGEECRLDDDCAPYRDKENPPNFVDQHCSGDQLDAVSDWIAETVIGHCCPIGYEYDLTSRCCAPESEAVRYVEMHDTVKAVSWVATYNLPRDHGYCEMKIWDSDYNCSHGEGPCRFRKENRLGAWVRANECDAGLECSPSINSVFDPTENTREIPDSACCRWDEFWTGRDCMPLNVTPPQLAAWTRSGGNPNPGQVDEQDGGGGIKIYSSAGAMLPNASEAAGFDDECDGEDDRWDGMYKYTPVGGRGTKEKCKDNECRYCVAAWPYRCPPSPIWYEARNYGDDYRDGDEMLVCNADFTGTDGTIVPWKSPVWMSGRYKVPPKTECTTNDCNCGRDMDESGDPADGPCPGNQPETACRRGEVPGKTHKCNCKDRGHGCFEAWREKSIKGNLKRSDELEVTVDPEEAGAASIIPPSCGRMQSKKPTKYPPENKFPVSWFNYTITEYDQNRQVVAEEFINTPPSRANEIDTNPPAPHTLLRHNVISHTLSPQTRYLQVDMNFTVENVMERWVSVKQCMWHGCSRLEEDVKRYKRYEWREVLNADCSKVLKKVQPYPTPDIEDGPPPNCCRGKQYEKGRIKQKKPVVGSWEQGGTDANGWTYQPWCKYTFTQMCGTPIPVPIQMVGYYFDDCWCDYRCWGCWHNLGEKENYPVTREIDGEQKVVRENFTDRSTVTSRPYGEHIRVENPITAGNSEVRMTVRGRIDYGYDPAEKYASGYLLMQAVDAESQQNPQLPVADLFGGARITIPGVVILDMPTRYYPLMHEMTALQSTLPLDFANVKPEIARLLRLSDKCWKWRWNLVRTSPPRFELVDARNPLFFRWHLNPGRKYQYYNDAYMAYGTKYTWNKPLWLIDRADPDCVNHLIDTSFNIGLLRNYHEDEPNYYDYASFSFIPQNIEEEVVTNNYDPTGVNNVEQIELSKKVYDVFLRYAPDCRDTRFGRVSEVCAGQDTSRCPDMCSEIATVFCNNGRCDCQMKQEFQDLYPVDEDTCRQASSWLLSELERCEGVPSKYKNYCANGRFHAYWRQGFQFRYQWSWGDCEIEYIKECEPEEIMSPSYGFLFDTNTLSMDDWNNAELKLRSNLRSVKLSPFGDGSPCEQDVHRIQQGGLDLLVEKPHPKRFYLEGEPEEEEEEMDVRIVEEDTCTERESSESGSIHVEFHHPYAEYTGWYEPGEEVTIRLRRGHEVIATMKAMDGFGKSPTFVSHINIPARLDTLDYLMDNLWILLAAYAAIMSYRFFSGRAIDFRDMWDEFHGKK